MLDVRVLGPMEVEAAGQSVALGGVRQRAVLAALATCHPSAVTVDQLADLVWDAEPPESGPTTLRAYISVLRRALRAAGGDVAGAALRTTAAGYALDLPADAIDAACFERLIGEGRAALTRGEPAAAVVDFDAALGLWRGNAYQDFGDAEFAAAEARRLADLRLDCTEDRIAARLALGEHQDVVAAAESHSARHPLRERATELLMTALYRCGRQAEALRAYDRARDTLVEELGIEPSPSLAGAHQAVLDQRDPAPDLATARSAPHLGSEPRTLIFLFGDVQGSTELLRDFADGYADALEATHTTIRDAVVARGGRDLRTWGDGMFAAFDTAGQALAAAVEAQRALDRADAFRVRMGLHAGEATWADGDYTGLAVHVAARIHEAGHGGQILASAAVRDLVEPDDRAAVSFRDLGRYRLDQVLGDMRLFEVMADGLSQGFPSLRATRVQTGNVPRPATRLVGRRSDIADLDRALDIDRLVTLTGVGGVGKTRLAIEYGLHAADSYDDGVWLCELAGAGSAVEIVATVTSALGIDTTDGVDPRTTLLGALSERGSLLILDNCEHLLDEVADLVEEIVARSPGVRVLATSREPLGVAGEQVRIVRSLGVPAADSEPVRDEALELFEQRARAARPDFTLDAATIPAVAALCRRLDGIPLAIELAAARMSSLSPAMVLDQLDRDSSILRATTRGRADRHRTLQAAIGWSYDLLTPEQRRLFDRLAVFSGGFTLDAAASVCGGDAVDVADGIAQLVDKSMVTAAFLDTGVRYSLLETLRQFGEDRLADAGELDGLAIAHAAYYRDLVDAAGFGLGTADEAASIRVLRSETDNMRAAVGWALAGRDPEVVASTVAVGTWLVFIGVSDVTGWASDALGVEGVSAERRALALVALRSMHLLGDGNLDGAGDELERALSRGDPDNEFRVAPLSILATVRLLQARPDDVRAAIEEGVGLCRRYGRVGLEPLLFARPAILVELQDGAVETAVTEARSTLQVASERSSRLIEERAAYLLGETLAESDPEEGLAAYDRAIEVSRKLRTDPSTSLIGAASLRSRAGDHAGALRQFHELIDILRLTGATGAMWTTIRNAAELLAALGANRDAAVLAQVADASDVAPPLHGVHGDRYAGVRRAVRDRLGPRGWSAAADDAASLDQPGAVAYALDAVARAAAALHEEASRSDA